MRLVLDTCAILWLAGGAPMTAAALRAIRTAQATDTVLVSPISAWEIGVKVAKGRLDLDAEPDAWFERFAALPGVAVAALTSRILVASTRLPGAPPADPADRIIVATAQALEAAIVTRDARILPYAALGHARAVAC